jgi:hypothetical protein
MNPRNVINFFRTPTGAFIAFAVILVVAFIFVKGFYDPNKGKPKPTSVEKSVTKPQLVQTVERAMVPFNPPASGDMRMARRTDNASAEQRLLFTPISLYPDASSNDPKPLSKFYAPYGRLIPCELIVTIDSSSIQTPIIGLITEDIYHDGRLIITAGTEVHGSAQADRKRERIASNGEWTLVWQTGEELRLSGIALDREKDPGGTGWGITDGSAGLRGQVLKTDNLAEIKLFAATFLSGAASAMTQTRQTIVGTELLPSLQNAPLQGAQNVLATYAQQILDTIQRDGFYVRVPAGKEFYLYVMQTIDKSDATVGGTRVSPTVETNDTPTRASLFQFHRGNP